MTHWDYSNPVQIVFGPDRLRELPALVGRRRALLVTTPGFTERGITALVHDMLGETLVGIVDSVQPNPDLNDIDVACAIQNGAQIDIVVGLGGGSALDTAKALSVALCTTTPDILRRHLEYGANLQGVTPLPIIAVPTTAGSGSEVTPFAALWDKHHERKFSLAHAGLYPQIAVLDPMLTLSVPHLITVATGLDALSQAFESIWNCHATPVTTAYALRAIAIIFATLPQLIAVLDSSVYRTRMMEASLMAGLAISKTHTALAHAMSYPITARYGVPHGLACSFMLPALLAFNAYVDDGRLANAANTLGCATVEVLHNRLLDFLVGLKVNSLLLEYLPGFEALLSLAPSMLQPGRADNNMRPAREEDVAAIIASTEQQYRYGMLNRSNAL